MLIKFQLLILEFFKSFLHKHLYVKTVDDVGAFCAVVVELEAFYLFYHCWLNCI